MFHKMRRHTQELSESEAIGIVERGSYAVLSLVDAGGYPYGVPLNYVYLDGILYFHSAVEGHKLEAIAHCNKASVTIVGSDEVVPEEYTTYFRSVIAFGRVSVVHDDTEKMQMLVKLGEKFNPGDEAGLSKEIDSGYKRLHMIRFDIEKMTGKEAIELVRMHKSECEG